MGADADPSKVEVYTEQQAILYTLIVNLMGALLYLLLFLLFRRCCGSTARETAR